MRVNIKRRIALTVLLLSVLGMGVAAQEQPYGNHDSNVTHDNWTEGHEDVDLVNVSHYISRVSAFVVGGSPDDPGAGPMFTGIFVFAIAMSILGTSRAGLVASGTMGSVVMAALAAPSGAGMMPAWLYGVGVMMIGFIAAVLYIRMVR